MKVRNSKGPSNKITFATTDRGQSTLIRWWDEKNSDKCAAAMLTTAAFLKDSQQYLYRQAALYTRLYGNQNLYSFAGNNISKIENEQGLPINRPTFNIIQSAADTLISRISQSRPQPDFLTDGSDYKERNLAKKLNKFVGGEFFRTKIYEKGAVCLRDALVLGTGVLHVFEGDDNKVQVERVIKTELLVDPNDGLYGDPRRIMRMKLVDRDVLLAMFPDQKKKVELAKQAYPDNSQDSSKTVSDQVMVIEAWSLPSAPGANDGRHIIACSMGSLLDEEYTKDKFPFVFLHYSQRMLGFWSQGLAEQLTGTQIELNSILYTISQAIKLVGVPRIFQEMGSKVNGAAHNNDIGVIIKYQGTKPSYEVAPCNAPELYAERDKIIQYGYQQCGVSALQATSQKPAGLDSGEAIRSYDDISTDRFASLARKYDTLFVDLAYQVVDLAKSIAERDGEYESVYPGKNGVEKVDLPKASLLEDSYIIQCLTQSSLPKDPAGRLAKVTEMAQAGMISIQEARRLLDYPDLGQVEQLANAAEERILKVLDDIIEDGTYTPPDPFMDLQLALTLTTQYINLYAAGKLEESKLQKLRDFFTQVQTIIQASQPPPMPQGQPAPQAAPEPPPTSPLIPNAPQQ